MLLFQQHAAQVFVHASAAEPDDEDAVPDDEPEELPEDDDAVPDDEPDDEDAVPEDEPDEDDDDPEDEDAEPEEDPEDPSASEPEEDPLLLPPPVVDELEQAAGTAAADAPMPTTTIT